MPDYIYWFPYKKNDVKDVNKYVNLFESVWDIIKYEDYLESNKRSAKPRYVDITQSNFGKSKRWKCGVGGELIS